GECRRYRLSGRASSTVWEARARSLSGAAACWECAVKWLRALDARFLAPAPAERLATVRFLTGAFACGYLLARAPVLADFRRAPGVFRPVGLAAWLHAPFPPSLVFALFGLTLL